MKALIKSAGIAILLLSCIGAASAAPALHRCTVFIERATPDELVLELRSTSQSTDYSINVNYAPAPCHPWTWEGAQSWVVREELTAGFYVLPWADFYDEGPEPGMEACINWACQPEVVVIYWGQDYRAVLDYLFLPSVSRSGS